MKVLDIISSILLIIGGLNLGIMGVGDVNVIQSVFGMGSVVTHIAYILIGLAAIYYIFQWKAIAKRCK